jgi:hypothetical protein
MCDIKKCMRKFAIYNTVYKYIPKNVLYHIFEHTELSWLQWFFCPIRWTWSELGGPRPVHLIRSSSNAVKCLDRWRSGFLKIVLITVCDLLWQKEALGPGQILKMSYWYGLILHKIIIKMMYDTWHDNLLAIDCNMDFRIHHSFEKTSSKGKLGAYCMKSIRNSNVSAVLLDYSCL